MSASNDSDEAMIARWETTAHGIYTGDNAVEFARLIALARRTTAAEARAEELEALVAEHRSENGYIVGWNHGFDHAVKETINLSFPTMLRKMWSGGEVQDWLNGKIKAARKLLENKP